MMGTRILRLSTLFVLAIAGQVVGVGFLPATQGFTRVWATLGCLAAFSLALWMMARLVVSGINLVIVVPVMTCTVPLTVLTLAFSIYGESASIQRVCILIVAILLIGIASSLP